MKRIEPKNGSRFARIEPLEARALLDASPVISEFVANNDDSLIDGHGNSTDWLEIFNPGTEAADLTGWYLADDPDDLQQWRFPNVQIAGGDHLVVFASGNNELDPAGYHHTNFRLRADGDYLALVKPDGETIASQWNANGQRFPQQFEDTSYGLTATENVLVAPAANANILIPTSTDAQRLEMVWTGGDEAAFEVAGGLEGWQTGITEVGHFPLDLLDSYQALVSSEPSLLSYYTFDNDTDEADGIHDVAGSITANGSLNCLTRFDDQDCSSFFDEGIAGQGTALSLHGGAFAELGAVSEFIFEDNTGTVEAWLMPGEEPGTWFSTRNDARTAPGPATRFHVDYRGDYSGFSKFGGIAALNAVLPLPEEAWIHVVVVSDNGRSSFYVDGERVPDTVIFGWPELGEINSNLTSQIGIATFPRFETAFRGRIDELAVYDDALGPETVETHYRHLKDILEQQLGTDVGPEMADVSASAYLRIPFGVDDAEAISRLQLDMQFSDGFAAYLNGVPLTQQNVPQDIQFGSTATARHPLDVVESYNVSHALPALKDGQNVLAIHGLNLAVDDEFFTVHPVLIATVAGSEVRFFSTPTPGKPNSQPGVTDVVRDVEFSVQHGYYDQEFDVTLTTQTAGATLVYTVDGSEPTSKNGVVVNSNVDDEGPSTTLHIAETTNLRAAAFKDGWRASRVSTATYLVLRDLDDVRDLFEEIPDTTSANLFTFNDIVFDDLRYQNRILDAFQRLPTMSLTFDDITGAGCADPCEDYFLFGEQGVYSKGNQEPEIPVSVEYFNDGRGDSFQIDAGVRIAGHLASGFAKKPMKLFFREKYGEGRLQFPFFEESPVASFNILQLRSGGADAFSGNTPESTMLREPLQFTANVEMGQPTPRLKHVHLFINGNYWGVYYPTERPQENFAADHIGGDPEDWDIMNMGFNSHPPIVRNGSKEAWDNVIAIAEQGLDDPERYGHIDELVNLDNFIDHLIVKMFYGTSDWGGSKNYFMGRNPVDNKFYFFNWDSDFSAGNPKKGDGGDLTGIDRLDSPARLYTRLRVNPEFNLRFADRIHLHMFNDGPLTDARNMARFDQQSDAIVEPMILESVRWGTPPLETHDYWLSESDWLRNEFLAKRWNLQLQQFQNANLYPTLDAPEYTVNGQRQHGGAVASGGSLGILAPEGTVYYTLDGSDPRLEGGSMNPTAVVYEAPISISSTTDIRARTWDGSQWSALSTSQFTIEASNADDVPIRISEIHFNPAAPTPQEMEAGHDNNDEFEFVELANTSGQLVDLTSFAFQQQTVDGETRGIEFDFSTSDVTSLQPAQRLVVVENTDAFVVRYGEGILVAGQWAGGLSNAGEQLRFVSGEQVVHDFSYDDDWHPSTDGGGFSLSIVDDTANLGQWAQPGGWMASHVFGGTPGRPPVSGDLNGDFQINVTDVDLLLGEVNRGTHASAFDMNGDGLVTDLDIDEMVVHLLGTRRGDVDLDGDVDFTDFVELSSRFGESTSSWQQADFDGDGSVTFSDFVTLANNFGFTRN